MPAHDTITRFVYIHLPEMEKLIDCSKKLVRYFKHLAPNNKFVKSSRAYVKYIFLEFFARKVKWKNLVEPTTEVLQGSKMLILLTYFYTY